MWWAGSVEKFVQVIQDRWRASIHSWTQALNREANADGDPAADGISS